MAAAGAEASLRETNANALPDVDDAIARSKPAVTFAGEVEQFARGVAPVSAAAAAAAAAADTVALPAATLPAAIIDL